MEKYKQLLFEKWTWTGQRIFELREELIQVKHERRCLVDDILLGQHSKKNRYNFLVSRETEINLLIDTIRSEYILYMILIHEARYKKIKKR